MRLGVLLGLFGVLQAGALLIPGRLGVDEMWGDVLHLMDGVARVRLGQVPHLDFMTPLGTLSLQAVAMWDAGPGMAALLANALVMAMCLPLALWLGASRLSFGAALALGLCAMTLCATLSWTGAAVGATAAMNYNRWGWAATMLVLPILLVPPRRPGQAADWGDGLALGLTGALVVFMKLTFVAALGPAWLVWALAGRGRAALVSLGAAALGAAVLIPATGGPEAAVAYAQDLIAVANSATRASPGAAVGEIASAPLLIPLTLGCVAGALALLRGGLAREAALFALGAMAIYLASWQNYDNQPTGAVALPFVLLALAPRAREGAKALGWPAAAVLRTLAVALLALTVPPFLNMERSVFANWRSLSDREQLLPDAAPDIWWEATEPRILAPADEGETRTFGGVEFATCQMPTGYVRAVAEAAEALRSDPALRGRTVMNADIIDALWLPAGAPPLPGAQLWLYAPPTRALLTAELLAVPRCPIATWASGFVLDEAQRLGLTGAPVARTTLWTIFELRR